MSLLEVISLTYGYYNHGRAASDEVLKLYASDLSDLDPSDCISAYHTWRRNPKNKTFPLPAQIREIVCPDQFIDAQMRAREIAARIVGAISKYGWNNSRDAQQFIGPEGWAAVDRAGGWTYLCENVGHKISQTTLQAQLRDQLEGILHHGLRAIENSIGVAVIEKLGPMTKIGSL